MRKLTKVLVAALFFPGFALAEEAAPAPAAPAAPVGVALKSKADAKPEAASAPVATAKSGEDDEEGGGHAKKPFRMGVILDHSVGQGTFVNAAYYSQIGGALVLSPSYGFSLKGVKLNASAKASLSWEYSLPNNINGRRIDYSDIRLGLSAPGIFKETKTGISMSTGMGLLVPITLNTWHASTITQLSANVSFSKKFFEKLSLGWGLSGSRGIHVNSQNLVSRTDARDDQGNLLFICRTDEQYCGVLGNNTAWSVSTNLNAGYTITEKLSVSMGFGLGTSFKYAMVEAVDEYTPKALDSNGNPVAKVGMGRSDNMNGSIGLAYNLNETFNLSAGMGTGGAPLTRDNKHLRFPWFDFISGADSLTNYSVSLSATF